MFPRGQQKVAGQHGLAFGKDRYDIGHEGLLAVYTPASVRFGKIIPEKHLEGEQTIPRK
jgi:hypothetical protein